MESSGTTPSSCGAVAVAGGEHDAGRKDVP
jgi:hypothetical protein